MSFAAGFATIAGSALLGLAIVRLAGLRLAADPLASGAYAYVAGTVASGALTFVWLVLSLPNPALAGGVVLLAAAALHGLASRRARRAPEFAPAGPAAAPHPLWQRAVFAAAVAACLASTCDRALLRSLMPVVEGDEAFIWAARAKILYAAGGLNAGFREEVLDHVPDTAPAVSHPDYPILNSLLQAASFFGAGGIGHFGNRLPIQAFAIALTLACAAALRRVSGPLAASALLVALQSQFWVRGMAGPAMADGMVALGLLCAIDCLLREEGSVDPAWARLGGLALGLLAWSKHEGAMIAVLAAAAVIAAGPRRSSRLATWLLPAGLAVCATWATNSAMGFRNDLAQAHDGGTIWTRFWPGLVERGPAVASLFWRDWAAAPQVSRLLVFPLVLGLGFRAVRARRRLLLAVLVILAALAVDLAVFVATPRDLEWHWRTAGARVLSQLNPAIAIAVGAIAGTLARLRTVSAPSRSS